MEFRTPGEVRYMGRGQTGGSAICLIHNNLENDTRYYFSVRAYNAAGESEMSEPINVITLSHSQNTIAGQYIYTYYYCVSVCLNTVITRPNNYTMQCTLHNYTPQ